MKIYTGDSDRVNGFTLYEAIVKEAHKLGLAGATAYRGIESFGASHSIHTLKMFDLSSDLPIIIEIIDSEENINNFLPTLNALMDKSGKGGLIIIEEVNILRYKTGEKYQKK